MKKEMTRKIIAISGEAHSFSSEVAYNIIIKEWSDYMKKTTAKIIQIKTSGSVPYL